MARVIVYYTDSGGFGGNELALLRLISLLDRQHWSPVLYYRPSPDLAPLVEGAQRLDVPRREIPHLPLGLAGLKQLPVFFRHLKADRPDIFHAFLTWPLSCKWGLAGAIMARVPAILATENLFLDISYTRAARIQQRWLAIGVGRYIAISQAVARQLSQVFRIPAKKVQVIYNGIPLSEFDRAADPEKWAGLLGKNGCPIILTIARLDPQKGLRYLIEAAAQVPEATFLLVGDGPERVALEAQVEARGLQERVVFLGYRTDYPELFALCDLFVLPSLYEGMPLSLLEAMAAGCPVITTAIPGCNEVVIDGKTGLSVPPADSAALAAAIQALLKDSLLARRLAEAGRAQAWKKFSLETMAQQVTGVYNELLQVCQRSNA